MSAKDRIGKASDAARAARSNQYVKRLLEDQELRGNIATAYGAARGAYGRMSNGKGPTRALMEDKKVQRELRQAAEALREASNSLRRPPSRRRRGRGLGGFLLLVSIGGIALLVFSESARSKLLDLLFGAEEEFDYTTPPTGTPAAEQPSSVGAQTS